MNFVTVCMLGSYGRIDLEYNGASQLLKLNSTCLTPYEPFFGGIFW